MYRSTHVVPNHDGGWDVKHSNALRSSGHFDTKNEAIERARVLCRNQGNELVIHRKNGTIQNKTSYQA